MQIAPLPADEDLRLKSLRSYNILYTEQEEEYEELAKLASQLCGTSVALISLVESDHQWFKAQIGYIKVQRTSRDISFCAHTILTDGEFVIVDATKDERFADNPLVLDHTIRFYAGTPLVNEEGRKLGSLCVIDRNPKELTEDQLFALRVLGKQVVARMELRKKIHLLNEELKEKEEILKSEQAAKRQAEEANKFKGKFLAHMSHEIRTPLYGMMGMVEFLNNTQLKAEQKKYVNILQRTTQTLSNIINDLLDLSKIEAGKAVINPISCSIKDLAKESFQLFEPLAKNRKLTYDLTVDPLLPVKLLVDPMRISQITSNLISNAFKFTEKGSIHLSFSKSHRQDKEWLRLGIADTGIGISPEKQELIFEEFEQGATSTSQKYGGTGLGMAIVKNLVRVMDGRIRVKSPLFVDAEGRGFGTEFSVELPLVIAPKEIDNLESAVSRH